MVTENPLACNSLPNEAEIIPLPSDEVTPPVTKMYFADDMKNPAENFGRKGRVFWSLTNPPKSILFRFW